MNRPRHKRTTTPVLDILTLAQRVAEASSAGPVTIAPAIDPGDLRDARGYRRTPATMPDFHRGREPRNKGLRYPPDPPTIAECMAMLSACPDDLFGRRLFAAIVLMWQAAVRAFEALALTESDLDATAGRLHIRHGKGDKQNTISMAEWAWPLLDEWRTLRATLPNPGGTLLCVIDGPTAGGYWAYSNLNRELKKVARAAGVTRRMSPHQLRHAWAAQQYQAGVPLRTIQLHLRHENIGITDTYLRGLGLDVSREEVHQLPIPSVPATALLALTRGGTRV